jgi:hypothetical protein
MNTQPQMANAASVKDCVIHLMLKEGKTELAPAEPEQMMEEFRVRATQVGSVLEGILHEPHGQSRWGLNE